MAAWFFGAVPEYAHADPPAWYGADIQRELPPVEVSSDPSEQLGIGPAGESSDGDDKYSAPGDDPAANNDSPYDDSADDSAANDDSAPNDAPTNSAYDDSAANDDSAYDSAPNDDPTNSAYDDSAYDDSAYDDSAYDDSAYDDSAPNDESTNSAYDDPAYEEDDDSTYDDEELDDLVPRKGIEGPRPPITDVDPPGWLKDFEDWLKSLDGPDLDVMPILKTLGIGLLIVLCLIILATVFRRFRRFRLPTSPGPTRNALDDLRERTASVPHHEHAVESRWEVAIHALLLDALTQLSPRFAIVESPHITCREIAAHIETGHGPLTELVGISESCVFALIVATEDQYLRAIALHGQIILGEK